MDLIAWRLIKWFGSSKAVAWIWFCHLICSQLKVDLLWQIGRKLWSPWAGSEYASVLDPLMQATVLDVFWQGLSECFLLSFSYPKPSEEPWSLTMEDEICRKLNWIVLKWGLEHTVECQVSLTWASRQNFGNQDEYSLDCWTNSLFPYAYVCIKRLIFLEVTTLKWVQFHSPLLVLVDWRHGGTVGHRVEIKGLDLRPYN